MSVEALPVDVEVQEFDTPNIVTISGGHFVHDTFSAFVSPLLPLLIEKLSLSLTLAGSLSVIMQMPSLLSVLIGYIADRVSVRYLVIFAPAVTATLVTMLGFMPTYASAMILMFSVGISLMAFHAPAPAMIAHIAGKKVGRGMSYFMAGGELGRAVGPLLVGFGVTQWGIEGLWRLMIFGWIATAVLYVRLKDIKADSKRKNASKPMFKEFSRVFVPLFGVMMFRNFIVAALAVYMVVYLVDVRGYGLAAATGMLALYELAGVAGALSGGTLSDRIGRRRTIAGAIILSAVFMYAFLVVDGIMMYPVLILLGITSLSVTPVFQALVQDQLPENRATASGMFILYAFVIQAINTLIIGMMGDAFGLPSTFIMITVLSLISVPIVITLPESLKHKRE
jgi:FSR family fosmidomycin resistance protein-like MFS transporter